MIVKYVIRRKDQNMYHENGWGLTSIVQDAELFSNLSLAIESFNSGRLDPELDEICIVTLDVHKCSDVVYKDGHAIKI